MKILSTIILLLSSIIASAQTALFSKGTTNYEIVVSPKASVSENTAAKELQSYLKQISNAQFDISKRPSNSKKHIFVGYDKTMPAMANSMAFKAEDQTFVYYSYNDDIVIYGGRNHGTMYGVFAFLENELGVRWYTSDYTKVPHLDSYIVRNINHTEHPGISMRHVLYYKVSHDAKWSARNRLNLEWSPRNNSYGGQTAIWGAHTLTKLVPAERHYKQHPEYFALIKGKRTEKAQLCLSNPALRKIVADTLLTIIKNNPGYWAYDVSQGDNDNCCQCEKCKAIEEKYGSHAGLIVWFVNQIAADVAKHYPDCMLSTLSYRYTRQAPVGIKPASNVLIRLCDIECCFVHPLDGCHQNQKFMDDLKAWHALTDKLYIWDYVTCFPHYLMPVPNFGIMARNIQIMKQYGCIGLMAEGQHNSEWGEFSEMKAWLLAKLLWNPKLDVNTLAREFINDYYGKAAPEVLSYYKQLNTLIKGNTHYPISWRDPKSQKHSIFNDGFVKKSIKQLEKAAKSVKSDKESLKRINRLLAQIYYLKTERNSNKAIKDGTVRKLQNILKEDPTVIDEHGTSIEGYIKQLGYT